MDAEADHRHPASFRDPAGFVFERDGRLLRRIEARYRREWERLSEPGGLHQELVADGLLIPHELLESGDDAEAPLLLAPRRLAFVSHPAQWCFSQLRAAALVTLELQSRAFRRGFVLTDARAANIQFEGGRPLLIDSLSFRSWDAGRPWRAYRQYCEQFLAPLALMRYVDVRLGRLFRSFEDGIPLPLAWSLLPLRARCSASLLLHVGVHARAIRRGERPRRQSQAESTLPAHRLNALVQHLRVAVERLVPPTPSSESAGYADEPVIARARDDKLEAIIGLLSDERVRLVYDLGSNDGTIARGVARRHSDHPTVLAFDADHDVTELSHRLGREGGCTSVLPLVQDILDPDFGRQFATSPEPFGPPKADVVLALALIHHVVLGRGMALPVFVDLLASMASTAILEFVPPDDPWATSLAARREPADRHPYDESTLRISLARRFVLQREVPLPQTTRRLLLLRRKDP